MENNSKYAELFGDFGGRTWINTAHQGALPLAAARAAETAISWKVNPSQLTLDRFERTPESLRESIAALIGASTSNVVLANSASYGLHAIANALQWKPGDEIIVLDDDFPSDIYPWLMLENRSGISVRRIKSRGANISPDELSAAINSQTRLFCANWVHSLKGGIADLDSLGEICRSRNVLFVVNGSQAVGARPIDVSKLPIDALTTVGFKWLCGPYATGFSWFSDALLNRMNRTKAYWLSLMSVEQLSEPLGELSLGPVQSAKDFDVFCTANFFNFCAFDVAIRTLHDIGIEKIAAHNRQLIQTLVDKLSETKFRLQESQRKEKEVSALVFIQHPDPSLQLEMYNRLISEGFNISSRAGKLRVSPHLYNSIEQVESFCECLSQ